MRCARGGSSWQAACGMWEGASPTAKVGHKCCCCCLTRPCPPPPCACRPPHLSRCSWLKRDALSTSMSGSHGLPDANLGLDSSARCRCVREACHERPSQEPVARH
jgi:hypothetical protein